MGFGYTFNLADLIRKDWRREAEFYIFEKALQLGIFKREAVYKIWQEHLGGRKNYSPMLWGLVVLGLWKEMYYE